MSDSDVTYRFRVSVRLRHPSENLTALSEQLGLEPSRSWFAGERRTTPRGEPLDGLWDHSYSTMPVDVENDDGLEAALERMASFLSGNAQALEQHVSSGGSIELFIGYFQEGFNSGFSLSAELMSKYAALGVNLDFDVYGQGNEPA